MTEDKDKRIAELETQVRLLIEEGQILMDALGVFADEDNWELDSWEEDAVECACGLCDGETCTREEFIFTNCDGLDPLDFAQRTIQSLRA